MKHRTLFISAGLVLLMLAADSAFAQSGGAQTALETAASDIGSALSAMTSRADLKAVGNKLFAFFVIANLVYLLIKGYATGGGISSIVADLVPLAVMAGVVQIFLDKNVGDAIVRSIDALGGAVTGEAFGDIGSLIRASGAQTIETMMNIFKVGSLSPSWDPSTWPAAAASYLVKLVAVAVTAFFLVFALAVYLAVLVTSQVAVTIALIMAPFFVPFLLFPPASFLFDGWLRFTLGTALMKVMGMLMFQITGVIMTQLVKTSALVAAKTDIGATGVEALTVDLLSYSMMILLGGLSAYLMMQVPSISTGLISGSGGAGGFAGWGGLVKSTGTRGVMGGMKWGRENTMAAQVPGGSGSGKGSPQLRHAGSRLQAAMPNFAKPAAFVAGHGVSAARGAVTAGWQRVKANRKDATEVQFDAKGAGFSSTAERAHGGMHSAMNAFAKRSSAIGPVLKVGPPAKGPAARDNWVD